MIRFTSLTKATFLQYFGVDVGLINDDGYVVFSMGDDIKDKEIAYKYEEMNHGRLDIKVDIKKWLDISYQLRRDIKDARRN